MYKLSSHSNEAESRCGFLLKLQYKGSSPHPINPAFVNSQESVPLFLQENYPSTTVSRRVPNCGKLLTFPCHSLQEALLSKNLECP